MARSMSRVLRSAGAVAVIGIVLAACGSGSDSGSSSDGGNVQLSLWDFGGTGLEKLIPIYEKAHPNIKIVEKKSDFDPHHANLVTALASGKVPDIAFVEISYTSKFKANPGNFVDLRTLGADKLKSDYLDWRWENGVAADGSVIGLPTDVGGMAIAYRTDLFSAAGLPTQRDEVSKLWPTWDDFIKVGTGYASKTGKKFIDNSGTVFTAVLNQGTQKYYSDEKTPIYSTNPQVKLAWDDAIKAYQGNLSANIPSFAPEWNAGMNSGSFATMAAPAWMLTYIQTQAPNTKGKWDVAALPGGGGNWGGSQITIPAKSKHVKEAWDFISWAMAPEQQLTIFKESGNFPTAQTLYDTQDIQGYSNPFFSGAPVGPIYATSAKALKPVYEGPNERAIGTAFTNALGRVEQKAQSPDEAWTAALKDADTAAKG